MIYTVGSWERTGPVEINAKDLTDEENALLMRLFEMGCGPRDGIAKGKIVLSYDRDRDWIMEEERIEHERKFEELHGRARV